MTTERIKYVFEYYKGQMVIGFVALIIGCAVLSAIVTAVVPAAEYKIQIAVQGKTMYEGNIAAWTEQVADDLGIRAEEVKIHPCHTAHAEDLVGVGDRAAYVYRYAALIQGKNVDVLLGDLESTLEMPTPESLYDLRQVFTESEWEQLMAKAEGLAEPAQGVLKCVFKEGAVGKEAVYDDSLSLNEEGVNCYYICLGKLPENVVGDKPVYAGIPTNTPRLEAAKEWIWKSIMG